MAATSSYPSEDSEPQYNLRRVYSRKGPNQRQGKGGRCTSSRQTNRLQAHQSEEVVVPGSGHQTTLGGLGNNKNGTEKMAKGRGSRAPRGRGRKRNQSTEEMDVERRERGNSRGSGINQENDTMVVKGRGRGRTDGRGPSRGKAPRGRGRQQRGTSKGQSKARGVSKKGYSDEDLTRVALLQQRRSLEMNERLARMGVEELRHLLGRILTREPGMVFDVVQSINPDGRPPSPSSNAPDSWCTCGRCREMPTDLERKCCGLRAPRCISILAEFDLLVIDPMYLRQFNRYRGQIFGIPGDGDNTAMRHAAYTQFILLKHGKLGHRNRRVIPSCCVWQIRTTFPEASGVYRSFVPA